MSTHWTDKPIPRIREKFSKDWHKSTPQYVSTVCNPIYYYPYYSFDLPYDPPILETGRRYEYMEDVVGTGTQKVWYKPVYHEQYAALDLTDQLPPWADSQGATGYWRYLNAPPEFLDTVRQALPYPPASLLDDFAARAEKHFIQAYDTPVSLINCIIELIQLCEGNILRLESLAERLKKMASLFKAKFGHYLARGLSRGDSCWLAWSFAIKPSLSDVMDTFNVYKRALKRILWLKKVNHRWVTVQYRNSEAYDPGSCTVTCTPPGYTHRGINWIPGSYRDRFGHWIGSRPAARILNSHFRLELEEYHCHLNASGAVTFNIPDEFLEGIEGLGCMIAAMNSLYDPWGVAWEAIPWTWAIDYFLSEKTKLERFKQFYETSPTPYPLGELLDTGHSVKIVSYWRVFVDNHEYGSSTDLGTFWYRVYLRKKGLPYDGDSSPFRVPFSNWTKTSLLAACASQRIIRRR